MEKAEVRRVSGCVWLILPPIRGEGCVGLLVGHGHGLWAGAYVLSVVVLTAIARQKLRRA